MYDDHLPTLIVTDSLNQWESLHSVLYDIVLLENVNVIGESSVH